MDTTRYGLVQLLIDGGAMMVPLLLASVVALGVVFAKAQLLWTAPRDAQRSLVVALQLRPDELQQAVAGAETARGPVAAVLRSGLSAVLNARTEADAEAAMRFTALVETEHLERGLAVLATTVVVAPLLGFLGTVWGMIAAFGAIESAGQVDAALVAGGIKVALITTAAGLAIAIPATLAHSYLIARVDAVVVAMQRAASEVIAVFGATVPVSAPAEATVSPVRRTERGGVARRRVRAPGGIPTSSMADIAFLLLIFFLTTTVFDQERGLAVTLPQRDTRTQIEVAPADLLVFRVGAAGAVTVREGEAAERRILPAEVEPLTRRVLARNPRAVAVIRTAPSAQYDDMVRVLDGVRAAGAERFALQLADTEGG